RRISADFQALRSSIAAIAPGRVSRRRRMGPWIDMRFVGVWREAGATADTLPTMSKSARRAGGVAMAGAGLLLVAALAGGCAAGGGSGASGYMASYEAGRYSEAYDAASRVADRRNGAERERAALVAGLS